MKKTRQFSVMRKPVEVPDLDYPGVGLKGKDFTGGLRVGQFIERKHIQGALRALRKARRDLKKERRLAQRYKVDKEIAAALDERIQLATGLQEIYDILFYSFLLMYRMMYHLDRAMLSLGKKNAQYRLVEAQRQKILSITTDVRKDLRKFTRYNLSTEHYSRRGVGVALAAAEKFYKPVPVLTYLNMWWDERQAFMSERRVEKTEGNLIRGKFATHKKFNDAIDLIVKDSKNEVHEILDLTYTVYKNFELLVKTLFDGYNEVTRAQKAIQLPKQARIDLQRIDHFVLGNVLSATHSVNVMINQLDSEDEILLAHIKKTPVQKRRKAA